MAADKQAAYGGGDQCHARPIFWAKIGHANFFWHKPAQFESEPVHASDVRNKLQIGLSIGRDEICRLPLRFRDQVSWFIRFIQ